MNEKKFLDFSVHKNSIYLKNNKLLKIEENKILKLLSYISPRRKMIDVGACEGYWSVLISPNFDNIQSYEPIFENFKLLESNTKNLKNIKNHNFSLSDRDEKYDMYSFIDDINFNSGDSQRCENFISEYVKKFNISENLADKILKYKKIEVKSHIYDELNNDDHNLDFINIDVNGDEIKVLKGMLKCIINCKPYLRVISNNADIVSDFLKFYDYYLIDDYLQLYASKNREILIN